MKSIYILGFLILSGGAVHLEWVNFHTGGDVPILRPADEIRKLLADVGVTPDKNIITY